ncbi:MAG: HAMP domain-containing sensor histidine kinase [Solirubrobacteraceae bacterium]
MKLTMGANAHPRPIPMQSHDHLNVPPAPTGITPVPSAEDRPPPSGGRPLPMLWRVFAANAAVFAVAIALLALAPVTVHASPRLEELVLLLVGLVVMLTLDLLLVRQALAPLNRLARVMQKVSTLRPGQRAVGFERSSTEVVALAQAFNEMLGRLETERRESSGRVLAAQETERLRIARELHDELGQTLTAVALRAEHMANRKGAGNPEFGEIAEIVQHSLADVRRISLELRPGALDELGLLNAMISLCTRVSEQTGISVRRELGGPIPDLPPDVELAVYRIAQEALTNAVRHSHASEVTVSLRCTAGDLVLTVKDNGDGLPEHVIAGGGLTGMRERAMLIGAALDIESTPGVGVRVTLRLELHEET